MEREDKTKLFQLHDINDMCLRVHSVYIVLCYDERHSRHLKFKDLEKALTAKPRIPLSLTPIHLTVHTKCSPRRVLCVSNLAAV